MRIPFSISLATMSLMMVSVPILSAPVYQPFGPNITYGNVTHRQRAVAANGNPAAGAVIVNRDQVRSEKEEVNNAMSWGLSGGLEYGNIQEIFDTVDKLSQKYKPSDPGEPGGDNPGQDPGDKPPGGIGIGEIIDIYFPEFRPTLEAVAEELATQALVLALIDNEGYATVTASTDFNFLLGRDLLGGTWTAGFSWSGVGKSYGITDEIEFDFDAALEDLTNKFLDAGLTPEDNPRLFDLIGDIDITIDPNSGIVKLLVDNDSSMLSKASKTSVFSIGYSRQAFESEQGKLFVGAELKHHEISLSRISVRFGDITDSEELFDALSDLDYKHDRDLAVDIGALWVGGDYQVGASLINVNEPEFHYPDINLDPYSSEAIIGRLARDQVYTMERQLKLEGSWFSTKQKLAVNVGLDVNSITDPVGDQFQWFNVSGSYSFDSFWLPDLRFGYRKNLAGSEISYVSAGVTAFKYINLDLASALDTVVINGSTLPRGLMFSFGVRADF